MNGQNAHTLNKSPSSLEVLPEFNKVKQYNINWKHTHSLVAIMETVPNSVNFLF